MLKIDDIEVGFTVKDRNGKPVEIFSIYRGERPGINDIWVGGHPAYDPEGTFSGIELNSKLLGSALGSSVSAEEEGPGAQLYDIGIGPIQRLLLLKEGDGYLMCGRQRLKSMRFFHELQFIFRANRREDLKYPYDMLQ